MAGRGLKNFRRESYSYQASTTWRLVRANDGSEAEAFSYFCRSGSFLEKKLTTRKRYAEVLSHFFDFLEELDVWRGGCEQNCLAAAIRIYPALLRDGSLSLHKRMAGDRSVVGQKLAPAIKSLNWPPYAAKSFDNTLAPINAFLRSSADFHRLELERLDLVSPSADSTTQVLGPVPAYVVVTAAEEASRRSKSPISAVTRAPFLKLQRPHGLRKSVDGESRTVLDFPFTQLRDVVAAATCYRDQVLWLSLAAAGLRTSEGCSTCLEDIDFENQRINLFEPIGPRILVEDPERVRWKGRKIAETYLIPELQNDLFAAIHGYLREEFVPRGMHGSRTPLLQYRQLLLRGEPFSSANDSTLIRAFARAQQRAKIAPPPRSSHWELHSLRHLYGVYMLNDLPIDPGAGLFGLSAPEVQMLMGHGSLHSTLLYAKTKERRLRERLAAADAIHLKEMPQVGIEAPHPAIQITSKR